MSDKVSLVQVNPDFLYLPIKKLKYLVLLIVGIIFLIFYKPEFSQYDILPQKYLNEKKTFNILFWTTFFNQNTWYSEENRIADDESLKSVNCPVTNCFFTHNHSYLNNMADFDAIMIHGPEHLDEIPSHFSNKQLFIFVSLEAPTFIRENLTRYENYYNLTMTYRMDSDITWDYGRFISIETQEIIAPSKNPQWIEPDDQFFDENYMKIYENKTKSIAWFVSNCDAFNRRQDLVKKMQQFIDIDIYGKCGNLTCEGPNCDQLMTTTYKFYVSFENSLCQDYVTEKLFKTLEQFTIPLVFNGLKDITMFAPPKSFINVDEFDTVEDLVDYLKYLMDNPREYIQYFWWKKHYHIKRQLFRYTYCDLCQKLNDHNFMTEKHEYESIKSWYNDDMCNQTSHIQF